MTDVAPVGSESRSSPALPVRAKRPEHYQNRYRSFGHSAAGALSPSVLRTPILWDRSPAYPDQMPNSVEESRWPTLALIGTVKFRLGLKGYNVAEVDKFLSALAVEIGDLQSALEAAEGEVAKLRAQSAP